MWNVGLPCLNYLDDFAGVENEHTALFAFNFLREIFIKSGIEEDVDKACRPSQVMIFLGFLFDSRTMTMQVTEERLKEIKGIVFSWLDRDTASLKDIQRLLGKLNFVGACVRSSRVFINRILNWLRECYDSHLDVFQIPFEVRKDLLWWSKFLPIYNGISLIDYGEWLQVDSVFSSDIVV
jgi:hypothetical protein